MNIYQGQKEVSDLEVPQSQKSPLKNIYQKRIQNNKARYLPPSKLKKNNVSYKGRRTVKFKEEIDHSVQHFGPVKKEKKPAHKTIM